MAQFTVHRNKDPHGKAAFPFLVNVQSDLLDELQTTVVIPLTKAGSLVKKPVAHLMPAVEFDGDVYVLVTPQLAGIARGDLGPAAGSLVERRDTIISAMDFFLSGF